MAWILSQNCTISQEPLKYDSLSLSGWFCNYDWLEIRYQKVDPNKFVRLKDLH